MKIRNGFVSNSSSSSFLIVGIHDDDALFDEVMTKLKWSGKFGDPNDFYMSFGESELSDGIGMWGYDCDPCYVGMGVETLLKAGKTVGQLKAIFHKKMVDNWGISIPIEDIDLHQGECGSG